MARKKNEVEEELSQLRQEREQMDERIALIEGELEELLSLEEEAQGKFVNQKISEFNTQRDKGKPDPFQIGGQR
jgi:chromosome segregation ATPase